MSVAILRLGLWSLVLILIAYVLAESAPTSPVAEILTTDLLFKAGVGVIGLILLGFLVGLYEKSGFRSHSKCQVCGRKIPPKTIYCRLHLHEVLEEEDLRRRTMNTRLPD